MQHLDFFTPIIDDPYEQGQIAACNSASDVYAKGALDVIGVMVIMGNPIDTPETVMRGLMRGFVDFCTSVQAPIVGGHTIVSPWPIMGGSITAITRPSQIVYNSTARPGDVLLLTKPLGTQPAMGVLRVPLEEEENVVNAVPARIVSQAIDRAIEIMTTPNKGAAEAMVEVGVNAATDVTGFGFLGQADILAKRSHVNIELHTLPAIQGTISLSKLFGYGLEEGKSAETSGGLLISVASENIEQLNASLEKRGVVAYEVGGVTEGTGHAVLSRDLQVLEV